MYTAKNIALDELLKKYHLDRVDDLLIAEKVSDDGVIDFVKEIGSLPYYEKQLDGKFKMIRHLTIKRMKLDNTVEIFMPIDFWREPHKVKASSMDVFKRMDLCSTGDETLSLMVECGVGVRLAPGEETDVNWTNEFVEQVMKSHPAMKKIVLYKDGKIIEGETPVDLKQKISDIRWDKLDYRTVQLMAKEKNLDFVGKSKETLIKKLQDLMIKDKEDRENVDLTKEKIN